MGPDAAHQEGFGRIQPQGGLQDFGEVTVENMGWRMGITPDGGCYVRGGLI